MYLWFIGLTVSFRLVRFGVVSIPVNYVVGAGCRFSVVQLLGARLDCMFPVQLGVLCALDLWLVLLLCGWGCFYVSFRMTAVWVSCGCIWCLLMWCG